MHIARCKSHATLVAITLLGALSYTAQAEATPEPGAHVTDRLLWAGESSFVVLRVTQLTFNSYFHYQQNYERVEISVWDGRVINRCSLGSQMQQDTTALGDWATTHSDPDLGCDALPNPGMSHLQPLLNVETVWHMDDGVISAIGSDQLHRIVADQDFVASRLRAMTVGERAACEAQPQESWPVFGGCHLGTTPEACQLGPMMWSNAHTLFVEIVCNSAENEFTDMDASRTWLALGHQYAFDIQDLDLRR